MPWPLLCGELPGCWSLLLTPSQGLSGEPSTGAQACKATRPPSRDRGQERPCGCSQRPTPCTSSTSCEAGAPQRATGGRALH